MEKISIITVCYNAEYEIERTILSVVNQTYVNKEYIVIDGCSKDGTIRIIDKYSNVIQTLVSEPDKGIYDAMNKGINMATGEWLIFMNAGDEFASPSVLERIFSNSVRPDTRFIYSDVLMKNGNHYDICPMDFKSGALNHQCVIYKKNLHDEIGSYIVTPRLIISDYLFFIQVPESSVQKTSVIIAKYDGGGASSTFPARTYALCADVVFRRRTFTNMLFFKMIQSIGDVFPNSFKYKIKKLMH